MAAVAELFMLLFAFLSSTNAEEPTIILEQNDSYTFKLNEEDDFCLISRFVGEQKLFLWNTSGLWTENTMPPDDLKEQRSFLDRVNISTNVIHNLTHSDSGLYEVECWTKGHVTHKKNKSLTVCSGIHKIRRVQGKFGRTVDLLCEGATDNLTVQWFKQHSGNEEVKWTRVTSDSKKSGDENRFQVIKKTSSLRLSNFSSETRGPYTCLVINKQRCISSHPVNIIIQTEVIYRSVGETAVLSCTVNSPSDDKPLYWLDPRHRTPPDESPQNFSDSISNPNDLLVVSPLLVNDTGLYICFRSFSYASFYLLVCPSFSPPAIVYFLEGNVVTLECNHNLGPNSQPIWFRKTEQAEGTVIDINQFYEFDSVIRRTLKNNLTVSISYNKMVLSNVSAVDRGEYWCAAVSQNNQCIFTAKTLLVYRGPIWLFYSSYIMRSLLLVIPCAVLLTVIYRTRRREQLSDI